MAKVENLFMFLDLWMVGSTIASHFKQFQKTIISYKEIIAVNGWTLEFIWRWGNSEEIVKTNGFQMFVGKCVKSRENAAKS